MEYPDIAEQIIAMKNADLALRDELIREGRLGVGYDPDMEALHIENARTLGGIIDKIGYPSVGLVGQAASQAAWLIVQHAISVPSFMIKCLNLLEEAVENGDADPVEVAYLSDRIAVFRGDKQRYGTQFDWDDAGEMNPQPYDDLEAVNRRRKTIGLTQLEDQIELMRKRTLAEQEHPPKDLAQRRQVYEAWRTKVGWDNYSSSRKC